ncbi:CBS domain-containing protein [Marinococcus halophilus]|uniref:CBS domain-containing protein n=1 Tax=Marinococcus halophilus TaxID=1371 RepID=UPI00360C35F1
MEEIMVKDVITIERTTLIRTALELLEKHRIRHIPVIDENDYVVGIVADRDIRDASPSIFQPGTIKKNWNSLFLLL